MTSAAELRGRLANARLMLLFTPELCAPDREPRDVLAEALPHVDVVQVRIKGETPAAELAHWSDVALALAHELAPRVLVLVNDRVDVALSAGADGVHLGQGDMPAAKARALLGEAPLIGLSTHSGLQLAEADDAVDYLGFGPVFPTATKGYAKGLGAEAAWVASRATALPVFPIGGITAENASELKPVGRAAVSSCILAAGEPGAAAEAVRGALEMG